MKRTIIIGELIRVIRSQFALDWHGFHGMPHWNRVRENGLCLAELTGAKQNVVELFAVLHDSRRLNEGSDPLHGDRAAVFAQTLAGSVFDLGAEDLDLLMTACRHHSGGFIVADITVLTCWDADRLDLGRIGMRPDPTLLGTGAARDPGMIQWAYERSLK